MTKRKKSLLLFFISMTDLSRLDFSPLPYNITFYLSNLNFYLLIEVKRKFHYLLILNLDHWFIE